MYGGRDLWWHELMANASDDCPAEPLDAEHPLYLLYTSGTTGQTQGHPAHHRRLFGGHLHHHQWVFDLQGRRHLLVYGRYRLGHRPQLHRLRPAAERRHHADVRRRAQLPASRTASGASSTATRSTSSTPRPRPSAPSCASATQWPAKHSMKSLRLLGTVGEPINPEAWMWYRENIGHNRCPIVDTWWQTETGMIMIAPLPGATPTTPGSATRPLPGRDRRRGDARGRAGAAGRRRVPGAETALARHAAHHLWRPASAMRTNTGRRFPACTSPATARARTRTAISGSWAASTTSSTSPAIASAPWKWNRRWWRTTRWRRRRWWPGSTI